jgi:hypothetical protein
MAWSQFLFWVPEEAVALPARRRALCAVLRLVRTRRKAPPRRLS